MAIVYLIAQLFYVKILAIAWYFRLLLIKPDISFVYFFIVIFIFLMQNLRR